MVTLEVHTLKESYAFLILKVVLTLYMAKTAYYLTFQDLKTHFHRLSGHENNFIVCTNFQIIN